MPLSKDDQLRIEEAEKEAAIEGSTKLLVRDPTEHQKLSPFTVICVVLNRMIGESDTEFDRYLIADEHLTFRLWHICRTSNCASGDRGCWDFTPSLDIRCCLEHVWAVGVPRARAFHSQISTP